MVSFRSQATQEKEVSLKKINNFYLLGHSMGGMIVQEIAAMNIKKVEKLICYGTGPIGTLPSRFETIEETRKKILKIGDFLIT